MKVVRARGNKLKYGGRLLVASKSFKKLRSS